MKKKILLLAFFIISVIQMNAQDKENIKIPLIGDDAPSFRAQSTNGEVVFPRDFGRNWKVIFSHPKDFTPVCSSEILELAHQQQEYKDLGVEIIVLSTDVLSQHQDWVKALEEINYKNRGTVKINFPLIDDSDYLISNKYGLIHSSVNISENIRGVFIIDPNNKVRSINFYPMEIGRNMDEIKRTLVALQTVDSHHNIVTPANWSPGDHVMVPVLTDSEKRGLGSPGMNIHQESWFMNFRLLQ